MAALTLLLVTLGIWVTRLLHDGVASEVRSGVASGVGALSWIAFLPCALLFGLVLRDAGTSTAGWLVVAGAAVIGAVLVATVVQRRRSEPGGAEGAGTDAASSPERELVEAC